MIPYPVFKLGVKRMLSSGKPYFYIHPWELSRAFGCEDPYNTLRPHSSLGWKTPATYAASRLTTRSHRP